MKKFPWIKVEYVHIPTDYNTKITTMIAANQSPDLGLLNGDMALDWASQGKLVNVMDYLNNDPDIKAEDILPQTFYWWDKDKCAGFNGALEAFALFYNKDMFAAAGVETPPTKAEEAWTWEQFVEVCQKLTLDNKGRNALDPNFDAKNIKQFGIQLQTWVKMNAVFSNGGDLLSEDGTKFALSQPAATDAIQKWADLMNKYHVSPTPVQQKGIPGAATALASKKVAMDYDGQWCLLDMTAAKVNLGVGVPPKMAKVATMTLGEPIVIFKDSKNPKEAWEVVKWFMNPDNTLELQTSGLWMPILKNWYTDPALVEKWTKNPAHPEGYIDAVMNNAFNNGVPNSTYTVKNFPKIDSIVGPALDKVWTGEQTAEQAMKGIESKVLAEIKGKYPRP